MSELDDARALARPLHDPGDLDPLLDRIGDARFVLLGEASHGTHDFYWWREQLTRRLVGELGFSFVAVEGDWPDLAALDRCVRGLPGAEPSPRQVLDGYRRWPAWMWANEEVCDFAIWLRAHNDGLPQQRRVGMAGLDVYSLWDSLRAVLEFVGTHEPAYLDTALRAWRCFEPYAEDPQRYALATRLVPESCEDEVVDLLRGLRAAGDGDVDRFDAAQNAAAAAGAERYYRAMVRGGAESWNVRDRHMADTLDRVAERYGPRARGVVWEHNTHVGDARFTDMSAAGMVNVGQLVRERHGEDATVLVGFSGHHGVVVAADSWGAPGREMRVPAARPGSIDRLLHDAGAGRALLVFPPVADQPAFLRDVREHRAIGVVYDPDAERWGNYVPTVTGRRYDALLHLDGTQALHPLHREVPARGAEQETFPTGR